MYSVETGQNLDPIARRADEIINEAQESARRKLSASRLSDEVRGMNTS